VRAANTPRPADWVEPDWPLEHSPDLAEWLSLSAACYHADTSEFQPYYSTAYPYPVAGFRFHSGYRVDAKAPGNWAYHRAAIDSGRTRVLFVYAVFVPGQLSLVMDGLREVFGVNCPSNRVIPKVDMESGKDFAGPGDHSAEANEWADEFAQYAKSWTRVAPYANASDFADCWPHMDPRIIQRHVAKYSATPPSDYYSWQYYGATTDPSPLGAPRSCQPFGSFVDLNVIYKTIDQVEADYGITTPAPVPPKPPTPPEDPDMPILVYADVDGSGKDAKPYLMGGPGIYEPCDPATLVHLQAEKTIPGPPGTGFIPQATHLKWVAAAAARLTPTDNSGLEALVGQLTDAVKAIPPGAAGAAVSYVLSGTATPQGSTS
jgi:hypothetical protein